MANFMTRVELNGSPTWQDYENLHAAMKRAGFSRLIAGSDGKIYRLPHAQYSRTTHLTLQDVRDQAHAAARSVWDSVQVLTTEGNSAWVGLHAATQAEVGAV
jgi:hypothetical protein